MSHYQSKGDRNEAQLKKGGRSVGAGYQRAGGQAAPIKGGGAGGPGPSASAPPAQASQQPFSPQPSPRGGAPTASGNRGGKRTNGPAGSAKGNSGGGFDHGGGNYYKVVPPSFPYQQGQPQIQIQPQQQPAPPAQHQQQPMSPQPEGQDTVSRQLGGSAHANQQSRMIPGLQLDHEIPSSSVSPLGPVPVVGPLLNKAPSVASRAGLKVVVPTSPLAPVASEPQLSSGLAAAPVDLGRPALQPSFAFQFGSLSPGFMQIPARTSSAPPNLDEQKWDQARFESARAAQSNKASPASSGQGQGVAYNSLRSVEQSNEAAMQSHQGQMGNSFAMQQQLNQGLGSSEAHLHYSQGQSQLPPQPHASQRTPVSLQQAMLLQSEGMPAIQMQSQLPNVQVSQGGLPQLFPAQGVGQKGLVQQSMGQGMKYPQSMMAPPHIIAPQLGSPIGGQLSPQQLQPQLVHQLGPQMPLGGQLPPGMSGNHFGPPVFMAPRTSKAVRIVHPETHEELRFDARAKKVDPYLNSPTSGPPSPGISTRVSGNGPPQRAPVSYGGSRLHPQGVQGMNYFGPYGPPFYPQVGPKPGGAPPAPGPPINSPTGRYPYSTSGQATFVGHPGALSLQPGSQVSSHNGLSMGLVGPGPSSEVLISQPPIVLGPSPLQGQSTLPPTRVAPQDSAQPTQATPDHPAPALAPASAPSTGRPQIVVTIPEPSGTTPLSSPAVAFQFGDIESSNSPGVSASTADMSIGHTLSSTQVTPSATERESSQSDEAVASTSGEPFWRPTTGNKAASTGAVFGPTASTGLSKQGFSASSNPVVRTATTGSFTQGDKMKTDAAKVPGASTQKENTRKHLKKERRQMLLQQQQQQQVAAQAVAAISSETHVEQKSALPHDLPSSTGVEVASADKLANITVSPAVSGARSGPEKMHSHGVSGLSGKGRSSQQGRFVSVPEKSSPRAVEGASQGGTASPAEIPAGLIVSGPEQQQVEFKTAEGPVSGQEVKEEESVEVTTTVQRSVVWEKVIARFPPSRQPSSKEAIMAQVHGSLSVALAQHTDNAVADNVRSKPVRAEIQVSAVEENIITDSARDDALTATLPTKYVPSNVGDTCSSSAEQDVSASKEVKGKLVKEHSENGTTAVTSGPSISVCPVDVATGVHASAPQDKTSVVQTSGSALMLPREAAGAQQDTETAVLSVVAAGVELVMGDGLGGPLASSTGGKGSLNSGGETHDPLYSKPVEVSATVSKQQSASGSMPPSSDSGAVGWTSGNDLLGVSKEASQQLPCAASKAEFVSAGSVPQEHNDSVIEQGVAVTRSAEALIAEPALSMDFPAKLPSEANTDVLDVRALSSEQVKSEKNFKDGRELGAQAIEPSHITDSSALTEGTAIIQTGDGIGSLKEPILNVNQVKGGTQEVTVNRGQAHKVLVTDEASVALGSESDVCIPNLTSADHGHPSKGLISGHQLSTPLPSPGLSSGPEQPSTSGHEGGAAQGSNSELKHGSKKKKKKELLAKADAAGTTADLYIAYKAPEEKKSEEVKKTDVSGVTGQNSESRKDLVQPLKKPVPKDLDDWEDAAELPTPKSGAVPPSLRIPGSGSQGISNSSSVRNYTRDFLLTFKDMYRDLPPLFELKPEIFELLLNPQVVMGGMVERESLPSPGRALERQASSGPRRGTMNATLEEERWVKQSVLAPANMQGPAGYWQGQGQGPNTAGLIARAPPGMRTGMPQMMGLMHGSSGAPLLSSHMVGGGVGPVRVNGVDGDRWQRAAPQKGLIQSPRPSLAIHRSENRYEVGKVSDEEEAKQRQIKGILNKLTPQNFEKLFAQVKDVNIDSASTLTGVISQIFDKALMEPTFCEMYARFCVQLAAELPEFIEDEEKITFKRVLLNKCQEEFENNDEEGDDNLSKEEMDEKYKKARRRMLGNIKFIGELYKKAMLTERIMHECIKKLLGEYQNPDEEAVEALCNLMSTIGRNIDHTKAKEHIDAYFSRMDSLSNNMKLSSRLRFMLKDVIDLRRNEWQARRKVEGPKRIEEVHRDAVQERQAAVAQAGRTRGGSSMGSLRGRPAPPADYGRGPPLHFAGAQTGSASPVGNRGPSRFGQDVRLEDRHVMDGRPVPIPLTAKSTDEGPITLGPQGGLGRGTVRSLPPGRSVLVDVPSDRRHGGPLPSSTMHIAPERGNPGGREEMPIRGAALERSHSGPIDKQLPKDVQDRTQGPGTSSDLAPSTPVPVLLSEEELKKKAETTIQEFYSVRDLKEVVQCVADFDNPKFYPAMIFTWLSDALDRKDVERDLLATLLIHLLRAEPPLLANDMGVKGFEMVIAQLEEIMVDVPRAPAYLAAMLGKMVAGGAFTLNQVANFFKQEQESGELLETGVVLNMFADVLDVVRTEMGETAMCDMYKSSGLHIEDYLSHEDRAKGELIEALLQRKQLECICPMIPIERHVRDLFQRDELPSDILSWIEKNVPQPMQSLSGFLQMIMMQVLRQCVPPGTSQYDKLLRAKLKRYAPFLKKLASGKARAAELNQRQYIVAIQLYANELGYPPGLMHFLFDSFYRDEVISEAAYVKWQDDVKDSTPGRDKAIREVGKWFAWLALAQEEGGDEED